MHKTTNIFHMDEYSKVDTWKIELVHKKKQMGGSKWKGN